jgi:hypothetical protein
MPFPRTARRLTSALGIRHYARMDAAYYEEIQGRLHGLLIRLSDRLPSSAQAEVTEFIDHNELGVALEWMADALSEEGLPVTTEERADMVGLAAHMEMGEHVPQALAVCPTRL